MSVMTGITEDQALTESQAELRAGGRSARALVASTVRRGWVIVPLAITAAVWLVLTDVVRLEPYVLPSLPNTVRTFYDSVITGGLGQSSLDYAMLQTLKAAAIGYAIAVAGAFVTAALMSELEPVRRAMMPYVVGFQMLPKVALAPLMVVWLGFGTAPKVGLAVLDCFFPILIAFFSGLSAADRDQLELFRSMRATRFQVFRYIKLPTAAPMIFTGLDMGIVYALIGAIVEEFAGAQNGIGVSITQMRFIDNTAGVFAALGLLALCGMVLHTIIRIVERYALFWVEVRNGTRLT